MLDAVRWGALPPALTNQWKPPIENGQRPQILLRVASFRTETSADVKISTRDGDTVTLSMTAEKDITKVLYRPPVRISSAGFRLRDEGVRTTFERQVKLVIDGDLDAEERADIREVLRQVDQMIRALVKGRQNAEPEAAAKWATASNLDSLAGVAIDIEQETSRTLLGLDLTNRG